MIRVLHILGGLGRGGAESMVMNLYRNIDREKIQFDFIIHNEKAKDYYDEIISLGGKVFVFPQFNGKNASMMKKIWNCFFSEHTEYKILHSHMRSYASLYIPIAKKFGLKTIIHSHSTSNGKGLSALAKAILQLPLRHQADFLFTCSDKAGEWLFGRSVTKKQNYRKIPNAIDVKRFAYSEEIRARTRKEFGADDRCLVIGTVGRMTTQKNHLFLLDVFGEILSRRDNAILVIVGEGSLRGEIEKKADKLGIRSSVILTGARDDVSDVMQAFDCFVFPSKWEGLPVTLIEAQASGLPCFISDRITREVSLSSLVTSLSIDKGVKIWADAILSKELTRTDVSDKIRKAGFDIFDSAASLSRFYLSLLD